VLAARADSAGVQDLLFQADRVVDVSDRRAALSILFSRLAAIDPRSAAAIATRPPFAGDENVVSSIWRVWSRQDLDAALAGAGRLASVSQRASAARAIYWAVGLDDRAAVLRVESSLGIPPDPRVMSRHVEGLASRSLREAVDFIEGLDSFPRKMELLVALGSHLGRQDAAQAAGLAQLIRNPSLRRSFESAFAGVAAQHAPIEAIENWIANPDMRHISGLATAAMKLAESDPERAMSYLEQMPRGSQAESMMAMAIAQGLIQEDPRRALDWLATLGAQVRDRVFEQTVRGLAMSDPDLALEAARESGNPGSRNRMMATVIGMVAQQDPGRARQLLEQVPDGAARGQAVQHLASDWAQIDPEAAMRWVLETRDPYAERALPGIAMQLISRDPRRAIDMLADLDGVGGIAGAQWRGQIAAALADTESINAALGYVEQYRNSPEFPGLQAMLVQRVAQTDPDSAWGLVERMPSGQMRDQAITNIVGQKAATEPRTALRWVDAISDENHRNMAISMVASTWGRVDTAGAEQWALSLPAGAVRDRAIVALVGVSRDPSRYPREMIERIGDRSLRSQANLQYLYRLMSVDPARASEVAGELLLTDEHRQQFERLSQSRASPMMGVY